MTGDYTPDLTALLSADIIISTPEKWDGISRNWHTRSYVTKVNPYTTSKFVDLLYYLGFLYKKQNVFSLVLIMRNIDLFSNLLIF